MGGVCGCGTKVGTNGFNQIKDGIGWRPPNVSGEGLTRQGTIACPGLSASLLPRISASLDLGQNARLHLAHVTCVWPNINCNASHFIHPLICGLDFDRD